MIQQQSRILGRQIGRVMTSIETDMVGGASNGCSSQGELCSTVYDNGQACVCDRTADMYDCQDSSWIG